MRAEDLTTMGYREGMERAALWHEDEAGWWEKRCAKSVEAEHHRVSAKSLRRLAHEIAPAAPSQEGR